MSARWYWTPSKIQWALGRTPSWECWPPETAPRMYLDCGQDHSSHRAAKKHCAELNRPIRTARRAARETEDARDVATSTARLWGIRRRTSVLVGGKELANRMAALALPARAVKKAKRRAKKG
jgi:hypothetical protein